MAIATTSISVIVNDGSGTWILRPTGGGGSGQNTDIFVTTTASRARKNSNVDKAYLFDLGAGTDLSAQVIAVRWAVLAGVGSLATRAAGGVYLVMEDATNGYISYWDLDGNDTYGGGWKISAVSLAVPESRNGGTACDLTDVRYIGMGFYTTGAIGGGDPNTYIDEIIYFPQTGLVITGNSTSVLEDLIDVIDEDATNGPYGLFERRGGIIFGKGLVELQPDVSDMSQSDSILVFEDQVYDAGATIDSALDEIGMICSDADNVTLTRCQIIAAGPDEAVTTEANKEFDISSATDFDMDAGAITGFNGTAAASLGGSGQAIDSMVFKANGQVVESAAAISGSTFRDTIDIDAALLWGASIDIDTCWFLNNTIGAGIEHAIAGTYAYTDLTFANNTFDILNSVAATSVDSYAPTEDGDVDVYSGSIIRVAQQFTGTAGTLSRAIFSARYQGSPTGNVTAVLYANSGGAPTGAALATSEVVDITSLTTSFADIPFEFKDEYTLAAATEYHISIEYAGGDSSNRLEVEYLAAGDGGEACNTYDSSWSGQTYDCRFQVNRDGIVKINATDSNPSTYEFSAATKGAVIIVNTVNLTITVKDESGTVIENAQTAIYTDDASRTPLMNEDTNASGIAQASYNYVGDQDIEVRVRKASPGDTQYVNFSTLGKIESGGYTLLVTLAEDPNNAN